MTTIYDCSVDSQLLTGMRLARGAIGRGELVVIPTDTVYGVAADAFDPKAVEFLTGLSKGLGFDPVELMTTPSVIASDPPRHERLRGIVNDSKTAVVGSRRGRVGTAKRGTIIEGIVNPTAAAHHAIGAGKRPFGIDERSFFVPRFVEEVLAPLVHIAVHVEETVRVCQLRADRM